MECITTLIPQEGGIEACKPYGVVVNEVSYSVQAIAPDVPCAGPTAGSDPGIVAEPRPDNLVELIVGGKTLSGDTGLVLTLIEEFEDSRCASDVVCIWAGRANVVLGAESDGDDLGGLSLSIEGAVGSASETIKDYTIELLQLDPYPMSTGHILTNDYVAWVLVAQGEIFSTINPAKYSRYNPGQSGIVQTSGN